MTADKRPKILIVEDDFENQKFLQIFLKKYFEVEICDSEETFYSIISAQEFDIILMDISLRGHKDGLQLTQELRQSDKYKNIPIVGLSAHAFQRDKDNAYGAGVDIFLTKPVQNDVLLTALFDTINSKKNS